MALLLRGGEALVLASAEMVNEALPLVISNSFSSSCSAAAVRVGQEPRAGDEDAEVPSAQPSSAACTSLVGSSQSGTRTIRASAMALQSLSFMSASTRLAS